MKIQIFGARSVPARWGGFDDTASELSIIFAKNQHDVTVYIMKKYSLNEKPANYKGVNLKYIPTIYGKYSETIIHEIISAIKGLFHPADIVYVLGCRTSFIYILHKFIGRKVIFNTDGLDFERRKWGIIAKKYLKINYWIAAKITKYLIHDNTNIQKYFVKNYKRNGAFISIGGKVYDSNSNTIISKYKLAKDDYYFIACRIEPENNIENIINGFINSRSKKKLIIAGGANYKSNYLQKLKMISDVRLIFLGPVYIDNHIEELHANAFAYLHGHEVGGTNPSLLKAMGCSNLILANGTEYNKEVLGNNGLFFNNNIDDIKRIIEFAESDKIDVPALKEGARKRMIKYYNWDYSAKLHLKYFNYVLGNDNKYEETF